MAKKQSNPLSEETRQTIRSATLVSLGVIAAIVLCSVGMLKVYRYVRTYAAYCPEPPRIILKNRPVWMTDLMANQICDAARPTGGHSAIDGQMLRDIKSTLESNVRTNAWIKQVRQLRLEYGQRPGDTLVLDCEFRVPIALLKFENSFYLVDGDGISLPERYGAEHIGKIIYGSNGKVNIRVVEGISGGRPSLPGQIWEGDDLRAALDMVKGLFAKDYADEILKVDVTNFNGRVDPREAQIVLWTNHTPASQIRWGRPFKSTDDLAEVPTGQKLQNLQNIFLKYHRVDAGRPWIDIRFDSVTYPVAADSPPATASNQ